MSSKTPVLAVAACVLAAAAGYGLYSHQAKTPGDSLSLPEPGPVADAGALKQAPADVTLTDLDGKTHGFADYQGKLVVLNFWATWCGPCLHEIPALIKMQADYAAKGVQILGPAVDDPEDVRGQAPKLGFNYPVFVGDSEAMLELMTRLGNSAGALPFSVLIGPDGTILERQLGEFSPVELSGLIEKHLASGI